MISTVIKLENEKIDAHSDSILSVQFSPDGTKIVSGSDDQTIKVWDGAPPTLPNHLFLAKLMIPVLPYLLSVPERDRIGQCGLDGG